MGLRLSAFLFLLFYIVSVLWIGEYGKRVRHAEVLTKAQRLLTSLENDRRLKERDLWLTYQAGINPQHRGEDEKPEDPSPALAGRGADFLLP